MSEEKGKALDLDELFGQARAIKVKWQGKEYELVRLEGLGPRQIVAFNAMRTRAMELQTVSMAAQQSENVIEISEKQAKDIENIFDEMLTMLSKELPLSDMLFQAKMRTLEFYIEEIQGKKAVETALKKLTGRKRSPA